MRIKMMSGSLAAAAVLVLAAGIGDADPPGDASGTYALSGRIGWHGATFDTTLSLQRRADGTYEVRRRHVIRASGEAVERSGTGVVESLETRPAAPAGEWRLKARIKVTFPPVEGVADAVDSALGAGPAAKQTLSGTYTLMDPGQVAGWVQIGKPEGGLRMVYESGTRAAETADAPPAEELDTGPGAPRLVRPGPGTYLVGSELVTRSAREGDTVEVLSGPAELNGSSLALTRAGEVKLRARRGERVGPAVTLRVVAPQVTRITVLDAIELSDAKPPHYARALGASTDQAQLEPAAILQRETLQLEATLAADADLSRSTSALLTAREGDVLRLVAEVDLRKLKAGHTVRLRSSAPLNDAVAVNELQLAWSLTTEREARLDPTPLRVYTTHGTPVTNPVPRYAPGRKGYPTHTKLHMELACAWANGASRNIGSGDDSIGEQIDNQFRHLVHPKEYGEQGEWAPFVPHYPPDLEPPSNYDKLPGRVEKGRRSVSRIYYPSVGREDWTPYRNNFGWWVLETPGIAGGRCNQQASCISDILGTLGIRAQVYYIERTARGRKTGRALRRHYRSNISYKLWNFHGMCEATLADGTKWLYDGSGSSPPNRTNGRTADLMKVPGKYVKYWHLWRYDDEDGTWFAPMDDWPETWQGVPLQEGEPALDPAAPDGTYAYELGTGHLPDPESEEEGATKQHTFWIVNVGGELVTKLDEGKPEAPTWSQAVHGPITQWRRH